MEIDQIKQLASIRADLLMEYIKQILSDYQKVSSEIVIGYADKMCTFDITVPKRNFERYLNTGIDTKYSDYLNDQIFRKLIENFMDSETIAITEYYCKYHSFCLSRSGIDVTNEIGSSIEIYLLCSGEKFDEQVRNYNKILNQYIETHGVDNSKSL